MLLFTASKPKFDASDTELRDQRVARWNQMAGPRVGDFCDMPDGTAMRFSHDWGDTIQISKGGSFYMGHGYVSFSGGLEPAIDKARCHDTGIQRDGWFWFFHHDAARAHNGVDFTAPCRVFQYR